MSWKKKIKKNWNGKLYKVLQGNKSCHGGSFEWSLPEGDKPGDWTPTIEDVKMCKRGYHLTTHYAHWADVCNISIYEAEGDVVEFSGYDKVVCSRARLLRLVENPFSEDNYGNYNSGNYNSGDCNSGNYNSGNYNSGNYNSGNHNSGNYNSGKCNSGYLNSGNENSGDRNSGNYNLGSCNSGNYNSGNENSGNWNSGNYNSGCFCTKSSCIIFNKLAENWEQEYPEWIYFDLLPEGYKASWQKAFEKADINGIKELLALPNFDYEIFEEISSITRKQIEEKFDKIRQEIEK